MKTVRFNSLVVWIFFNFIIYVLLLIFYVSIGVLSKNKCNPHKKHLAYIDGLVDKL